MIRPAVLKVALVASLVRRALEIGRPPPQSTAERLANLPVDAPGLQGKVTIRWDPHQIPSIEAGSDGDLAFGVGVVHAHLRLVQLEVMRRLASGRVAELIGPAGVEIDRALRLMRFGHAVPAMSAALPDRSRVWAEGFVAGINHQIARAPAVPYEFRLLGVAPTPWTVAELLLVSRLAATDVSWLLFANLLRAQAKMPAAAWDALWPLLQQGDTLPVPTGLEEAALGLVRGSNSAAVAAGRSAGGAGMIASDPHLPTMLPPLWLIAGLHAPGLDVVGLMIPGLPVVALGRNAALAWGGTSLHAASSELIDVSAEPMTEWEEVIAVRGQAPVTVTLRETRFGPVVSDGLLLRSGRTLALRWVGHAVSDELTAMLDVMRAGSLEAFRAALRGFAVPGQTMVAVEAGPSGHAGRVVAAHLPRRPDAPMAGLVCAPDAAWGLDDLVEGAALPQAEEEVVASANERPAGSPVPVGFFFSPPGRAQRLRALLDTGERVSLATMRGVQLDVAQPGALALRDLLLGRLRAGPRQRDAVAALAAWDGAYGTGSAGALVFEALVSFLARRLVPGAELALLTTLFSGRGVVAQRIAGAPPRALRGALRQAARVLRRHGSWGAVHRMGLRHPLAMLPLVGRWFPEVGGPVAGGNETLNKSGHGLVTGRHRVTFGACARHVSDLSQPDLNWFVLLGGQDGWLGSATMTDQVALWQAGEAIPVPLRAESARGWPHVTTLVPA
ncbi:MAG: penicillin acylase family protein [Acetobacteraceae bacterium]|nr:penicillin acylase family protein [Acetobacteraceae bacterium]